MKLLGSIEQIIAKGKNSENIPKLEIVDIILMHCNVADNNYQQALKVLFIFVPDKQFWQLFPIAPHSLKMLKTTNSEYSFIEIWFIDRPFEIEYNVNIKLMNGPS